MAKVLEARDTYDFSDKNPNTPEEMPLRQPKEILQEIAELDKESALLMGNVKLIIENERHVRP